MCIDHLGHYKSHNALTLIRLQAFLTLIFEGVVYGVEDGGEDKITKKKKKKKTKALPFPNLTSIGLIEMTGCVPPQRPQMLRVRLLVLGRGCKILLLDAC